MYTTIRHKLCHARKAWPGTLADPCLLSGGTGVACAKLEKNFIKRGICWTRTVVLLLKYELIDSHSPGSCELNLNGEKLRYYILLHSLGFFSIAKTRKKSIVPW